MIFKIGPLFRLIFALITSLWCSIAFFSETKANVTFISDFQREEQVDCHEGWARCMAEEPQSVLGGSLRTVSLSRICGSRTSRLQPSQAGISGSNDGRYSCSYSFNHLKTLCQYLCLEHYKFLQSAASRRLYYVIALRHILC